MYRSPIATKNVGISKKFFAVMVVSRPACRHLDCSADTCSLPPAHVPDNSASWNLKKAYKYPLVIASSNSGYSQASSAAYSPVR